MEDALLQERPLLITNAELRRMVASGVFDDGPGDLVKRIELDEGRLVVTPSEGAPHQHVASRLLMALVRNYPLAGLGERGLVFAPGGWVEIDDDTGRGPDLMIREATDPSTPLSPSMIRLLCEVAHTSLQTDLGRKRVDYAGIGVPEYWVLDVARREVHVFRDPKDGDYERVSVCAEGQTVSALFWPEIQINVVDLF